MSGLTPVAVRLLTADLRALLGERASTGAAQRKHHSHGESWHTAGEPDVVVFPATTREVSEIVRIAARHSAPLVPFGAGTSLEGHVSCLHGGVSIDLTRLNRILRVSADDLDVTVEAGVTRRQLSRHLNPLGLEFWVDPGADATIGGMASTRASGTTSVRYGTMREVVLGLTVVLADGRIVRTGGRARKSAAGYDLTRLFVGAEGTLGVITELTLRLFGLPDGIAAAVCPFETLEGAVRTVIETLQVGVPVARIELLDERMLDAVNRYAKLSYPLQPTLFFEFHGVSDRAVAEHAEIVQQLAGEHGGGAFQWASTPEARTELWHARHSSHHAALALRPGSRMWVTDVCVPISALAACLLETRRDLDQSTLTAPIVGHVGDGNFHVLFVVHPDSWREMDEARALNDRLVHRAMAMGGTCTGEHGVGFGKMAHLVEEHGEAVEVMRAVKRALDPQNLMNPGKVVAASGPPAS
ncbi:MAG: FAD-binding protein [Acidimicrobiia bacterium]|nr:FAD-binding protein [Acidimicrobiia bacterium]